MCISSHSFSLYIWRPNSSSPPLSLLNLLYAYVWPCKCFYQALFADQFIFGRNRSIMANSSWWPSSLDHWSCSMLDFYQQHNCSRYICFSGWQGICNKNMIIIIFLLSMIITCGDSLILITIMLEVKKCWISKIIDMKLPCQWPFWGLWWALPTEVHRMALWVKKLLQWLFLPFTY